MVNALSRDLEISVWRGDRQFTQRFSRGDAVTELVEAAAGVGAPTRGTQVRFLYDDSIFSKRWALRSSTLLVVGGRMQGDDGGRGSVPRGGQK